ncbi:B-cell lymphoma/leukemia 10 isoform X2 [Ambystoma mexicanum]|uniref:B-cell lymphoma/leukemia 10 isoform X2 n=1 Tax=Ambystoma mexicanum TaxID=8296 RepID=UPI0037E79412
MEASQLTEDDMAEVKKDAIETLRPMLCEKLIAERHFDYLRSKTILTKCDTEEIAYKATSRQRAGEMLDRIALHPKGLDMLIESIRRERTQNFLIEKITNSVQRAKNAKLQARREPTCSACGPSPHGTAQSLPNWFNTSSFFEVGKTSAVLQHPEGESSLSSQNCITASLHSLSLPVMDQGSIGSTSTHSAAFSAILPRPGDPGAPALPAELQSEPEEVCTSSTDVEFHPLRSRSLSPP